jgi:uncharacterized protein (DUF1684 family)
MKAGAQTYEDSLLQFRQAYKVSLLSGTHPLQASDTAYLRFYEPDPAYRVKAVFTQVTDSRPFLMKTMHGGNSPAVKEYGKLYFMLKGQQQTLSIYRFMTRPEDNTDASIRLFIPFGDNTNYKETFGGGRYLDISASDLINFDNVILDFNKCYNPHTAYEKGYPYLLFPGNRISKEVKAGEKIFGHNPGY